ncbi:MAG: sulfate ABC transporter permease subunit CysW, partial [Thermoguttaceae bacterium]|nr:sulfate ABC transporter permease subunit CysW [Thermoguttaceae bacterium]
MGEFGAVMVVVGNSPKTNTLPLHINALYQSYSDPSAPFAVATLLAVMAILTLVIKTFVEWKMGAAEKESLES